MSTITWDAPVLAGAARRPRAAASVPVRAGRPVARTATTSRAVAPARSARDAGAPHLRLTARGRAVVLGAGIALALGGALTAGSAVADVPAGAVPVDTRTVQAGETLWGIASGLAAPGQDVREVVDTLADLNGLSGGTLQVGQQILVPAP